jgi:iron(III) transport system ATP-binding protein
VASVELRKLIKRYGELAVVDGVSLHVDHGLPGVPARPFRLRQDHDLAADRGLRRAERRGDRGRRPGGLLAEAHAAPEQRNMSMIFQSYAVWPHMTVAENVAYGLKLRKLDRAAIAQRLNALLATTRLEALAERYPGELSGGQQQRVALAQALIVRADGPLAVVRLIDEDELGRPLHRNIIALRAAKDLVDVALRNVNSSH